MIRCKPLEKIYFNPENGYTVAEYETDEEIPVDAAIHRGNGPNRFRAVGNELPVAHGLMIELDGDWQKSNYGLQYKVSNFNISTPTTKEGIESYLSSGLIKGIGPVTARRIVTKFGLDTFDVFDHEPDRLLEIQGITEGKLEEIMDGYRRNSVIRSLMVYLSPLGATPRMVMRIQEHFGDAAVSIVKDNPYRLCEVHGFGFKTVDPIATKSRKFSPEDPLRIKAAIRYVLEDAENEGHLFLYSKEIVERTSLLLNHKRSNGDVSERVIKDVGNQMVNDDLELLAGYGKSIYKEQNYKAERDAARDIIRILYGNEDRINIEPYLERVQKKEGIILAEKQKEAVRMAFRSGVSIITGGPGCGKTTVIRIIIAIQNEIDRDALILLCAPTGKARRRMFESTGYPALTIQKALGKTGETGEDDWNEPEMLRDDLIVADEFSMVDMHLACQFFSSIKSGCRFVLVGDKDQIPSVGPGNVFKELIECGVIPVTVLDTCFRQGKNSTISRNAKKINHNDTKLLRDDTFQIINASSDQDALDKISSIYKKEWTRLGKDADAIQVLSPLRKDTKVGANALNDALREIVNPIKRGMKQMKNGSTVYRTGDKVMQTKNNDEVSNGDIGSVCRVYREDGKEKMEVDFGDDRFMSYDQDDIWPLTHAYAMSVHKSQGSEYDVVILPMLPCFRRMLKRNIFYTAVTRAKEKVIIVGSWHSIWQAIHNNDTEKRNTLFGMRVREFDQYAQKRYRRIA